MLMAEAAQKPKLSALPHFLKAAGCYLACGTGATLIGIGALPFLLVIPAALGSLGLAMYGAFHYVQFAGIRMVQKEEALPEFKPLPQLGPADPLPIRDTDIFKPKAY